jgi:hypothetical protein
VAIGKIAEGPEFFNSLMLNLGGGLPTEERVTEEFSCRTAAARFMKMLIKE